MAAQNKYRPLVRLTAHPQHYLPLPFAYSLTQIASIKKFLPKTLTYHGVDALTHSPQQLPQLEKHKLKLKAVAGSHVSTGKLLKFYAMEEILIKEWHVGLVIRVNYNSKMADKDQEQHIVQQIAQILPSCLNFYNSKSRKILTTSDTETQAIDDLELISIPRTSSNVSPYDNLTLTLRYDMDVSMPVVKKQKYSPSEFYGLLEDDLANCLRIMRKYNKKQRFCHSVLSQNAVLTLHSFASDQQQKEKELSVMKQLIVTHISDVEVPKDEEGAMSAGRKDPSNRSLLLILLGLFLLYVFLKVHPLKQVLNDL